MTTTTWGVLIVPRCLLHRNAHMKRIRYDKFKPCDINKSDFLRV